MAAVHAVTHTCTSRGVWDDPSYHGGGLPHPDRWRHRLVPRAPLQSALGGADGLWAGEPPEDRDGLPGARPAACGGRLEAIPHLGGWSPAGCRGGERRADYECTGPAFLGYRLPAAALSEPGGGR